MEFSRYKDGKCFYNDEVFVCFWIPVIEPNFLKEGEGFASIWALKNKDGKPVLDVGEYNPRECVVKKDTVEGILTECKSVEMEVQ